VNLVRFTLKESLAGDHYQAGRHFALAQCVCRLQERLDYSEAGGAPLLG